MELQPVSYTHLDVYKRQVEVGITVLGGIAALAGLGHASAPPAAQSRAEVTVQQVPAVQQLHIFFSLLIPDITHEERQLLDEALIKTYNAKGITHDNDTLKDPDLSLIHI